MRQRPNPAFALAAFTAPVGQLVRRSGREDGSFMRRLAAGSRAGWLAVKSNTSRFDPIL